ncbi:MAG: hypothetical protein KC486_34390, partial [Myxococcales bacterium]|nr:hypothetical protein [Myxococcales bacterium]
HEPRPRGPGESPPASLRAGPSGETVVVLEGDPPPPSGHSRATLWLALAVPLGVAMRIVVALIEGREGMLVLLACASLFLSGLVVVGG